MQVVSLHEHFHIKCQGFHVKCEVTSSEKCKRCPPDMWDFVAVI